MEGNESAEAEPMIVDASNNAASRDAEANNDQLLISRLQQGLGREQGVPADNFNLGVLQAIANDGQESSKALMTSSVAISTSFCF